MKTLPCMLLCAGLLACTGSLTEPSQNDADGSIPIAPGTPGAPSSTDAATGATFPDARVNDGRVEASPPTSGDAAIADAASPTQPVDGKLSLALFNVVRAEPWPGPSSLPAVLQRVELPPRVSVVANAASEIVAVRFFVDGVETRLDTQAPFVLNESSDGAASSWSLAAGKHQIEARGFSDAAATGSAAATARWEFDYQRSGLPKTFTPLSDSANKDWVSQNLDGAMMSTSFSGAMGTLPYRLFTPPDYDASVRYPLLVYLHGRGERGTDNRSGTYRSTQLFVGPRSLVSPNLRNEFPAIIVVPQCSDQPDAQEWARWTGSLGADGSYKQDPNPWPSTQLLSELITKLRADLSIDDRRIYVTGESMGGFGTWEVTTRWPEVYAAGVPMAGYSDRSLVARIVKIPFWIFHGSVDEYNPVAGSRAMNMALKAAGGEVRYTEYDGLKHIPTFQRAWTQEPELLPWIFAQIKKP